jgi:hypothetical protein
MILENCIVYPINNKYRITTILNGTTRIFYKHGEEVWTYRDLDTEAENLLIRGRQFFIVARLDLELLDMLNLAYDVYAIKYI